MKNNKGFTLVELLAVIVVLGVVLTIVVRSVIVSMDKAKEKTEKVFVSKLEDAIEQYIDLNKRDWIIDSDVEPVKINKVVRSDGGTKPVDVFKMKPSEGEKFTFNHILSTGFIDESDLVNPSNEKKCSVTSTIDIYRDTDHVYYYQTNLDCIDTKDKNGDDTYDINTWPTLNDKKNEELEESGEEE